MVIFEKQFFKNMTSFGYRVELNYFIKKFSRALNTPANTGLMGRNRQNTDF